MMQITSQLKSTVITAILSIALTACVTTQHTEAIDKERMLAAAGFQVKLANTADKMAHLKTLPQRKIVPHQKGSEVFYVYADATYCKCIYAGPEKAYQRYQQMAVNQSIEEMAVSYQQADNPMHAVDTMDWTCGVTGVRGNGNRAVDGAGHLAHDHRSAACEL
jgi:hypothetical protein